MPATSGEKLPSGRCSTSIGWRTKSPVPPAIASTIDSQGRPVGVRVNLAQARGPKATVAQSAEQLPLSRGRQDGGQAAPGTQNVGCAVHPFGEGEGDFVMGERPLRVRRDVAVAHGPEGRVRDHQVEAARPERRAGAADVGGQDFQAILPAVVVATAGGERGQLRLNLNRNSLCVSVARQEQKRHRASPRADVEKPPVRWRHEPSQQHRIQAHASAAGGLIEPHPPFQQRCPR